MSPVPNTIPKSQKSAKLNQKRATGKPNRAERCLHLALIR